MMLAEVAMCDTMTKRDRGGVPLFAKNSDRHPSEMQALQRTSASLDSIREPKLAKYQTQFATLKAAHATLAHPYRALISRPTWIWGAEMGVNEASVAIGNEAVFTNEPTRDDGLLGMDILRLALHNSSSAANAVDLIIELLKRWGQGGDGSFVGTLRYSNSFLITDRSEAYVLESAGPHWAAKSVGRSWSISNAYSIGSHFDRSDEQSQGSDFSKRWANRLMEFFSKGQVRQATTSLLLESTEPTWMGLRDVLIYNRGSIASLDRSMRSITLDAALPKPTRTTASMVVEYPNDVILAWCCPAPIPTYHPFIPYLFATSDDWKRSDANALLKAQRRGAITTGLLKGPAKWKEQAARSARELESNFEARLRPLLDRCASADKILSAVTRCRREAEVRESELSALLGLR